MKRTNCKHESHQPRDAAASWPPNPGFPCTTHRAESIPLAVPAFTHSPYPLIPFTITHLPWLLSIPFFPTTQIDSEEFCGHEMQL